MWAQITAHQQMVHTSSLKGVSFRSKVTFQYGPNQVANAGDTIEAYAANAIRASFVEKPLDEQDKPEPRQI